MGSKVDIGEDINLIDGLTADAQIRAGITAEVGEDLFALLDDLRANNSTSLFPRVPDNDGDSISNAQELAAGSDLNFREILYGDVNLDGGVDFFDISPFISLLSTNTYQCEGDVNQSGVVDFFDISPFIALLSSQ